MSADIRCYDQNTGKLLFNIASQTSRIVGYVTDSSTSGTITVPDLGGGKLFWMLLDDDIDYQVQNYQSGNKTRNAISEIQFTVSENVLTYRKQPSTKFAYGIYV